MSVPEQQAHNPAPATAPETVHEAAEAPAPAAAEPVPALPDHPPTSLVPSASRWSRLSRGTVLAIGAGIGAAVVGACWAGLSLAGSAEETFSTDGTLTVNGIGSGLDSGDPCSGTDGYSDIDFGTQVSVTDAAGTLVAKGSLGLGKETELGCEFPFTVDDITPGSKFYTVEVSHRGGLTQTEDELRAGGLAFTLGD
ncbi:hypothetical protein [Streptomyces sp. 1-11]|uniref:hypothetical protein n=1 Tax=Streptomyces sp. 1-11 TaxID=2590549 RepID=UPI00117345FE|nr:hypothetical protein [Streptomyces sp. 1-11]GEK03083.1 hypothetical protein TNCT1_53590 [Streptomyces sp. 1-11]